MQALKVPIHNTRKMEPSEFARIRRECDLSIYEVACLLDCAPPTWHHQESGRRHDLRFAALARAVPYLVRGDLPPWCERGKELASNPRRLAVHARGCAECWDVLQAAAQILSGWHGRRSKVKLQAGAKLKPLKPWWTKSRKRRYQEALLPCSVCRRERLWRSNKTGVCRECKRAINRPWS